MPKSIVIVGIGNMKAVRESKFLCSLRLGTKTSEALGKADVSVKAMHWKKFSFFQQGALAPLLRTADGVNKRMCR